MKKSNGLVQAAVEHLETAERSWDKFVSESGIVVDRFPSEEQVLTYMSKMSRQRQRMCLAQRGTRRKGVQKNAVRNYVAEMANNLWDWKYPSFAKLDPIGKKEYWGKIFGGYQTMYAAASAPAATEAEEARAEQLVAQTEQVYRRKHVYKTEMFSSCRISFHRREGEGERSADCARCSGDHAKHGGTRGYAHENQARQWFTWPLQDLLQGCMPCNVLQGVIHLVILRHLDISPSSPPPLKDLKRKN